MFDITKQFDELKNTIAPFASKLNEVKDKLGANVGLNINPLGVTGLGLGAKTIETQGGPSPVNMNVKNYFSPSEINNVIQAESSNNPKAKSSVGAQGLMQIMPDTWDEINMIRKQRNLPTYNFNQSYNPKINREYGTMYLNERVPQILESLKAPVNQITQLLYYHNGTHGIDNYLKDPKNLTELTPTEKTYLKNAKLIP